MSDRDLILLIEDNEANSMLASTVLERDGFLVDLANSAGEAQARLQRKSYDLILMDFQLPGQDGLSLTRQLRTEPATASIPIVALTARAMAGDRERALDAGCSGYVSKPIDTRTFGNQVRELLRDSRCSRGKEGIAS